MSIAGADRYTACLVVAAALTAFLAVALPAIWSRHAYRREAALKVLRETMRALWRRT
ncbi:hypothetical protein PO587_39095 [Streptomyces gilvifuscus]|uniref:Uncharacterized protein n=1 Tax=Streptomyces gilvifuscus TaxID=1550617 RepID=A0ABT5G766_9ACTN|nr:hypothetical protein [Streptomyces gilvifuscus]MDC2960446.1 hypothetical protein [Streptomyces gilvifuscus]